MLTHPSIWGSIKDKADNDIIEVAGSGIPTDGTAGSGVNVTGPGSIYHDYTNNISYRNVGTKASPTWSASGGLSAFTQVRGTISAADIISVAAGKLGHADGYPMVAAPGAGFVLELISVVAHYDFATAAYTAGGNITVNWSAGSGALTGLISAATWLGAAADTVAFFVPLSTVGIALVVNRGFNLVSAVAYTDPGTAVGVIRYVVNYRQHKTGF